MLFTKSSIVRLVAAGCLGLFSAWNLLAADPELKSEPKAAAKTEAQLEAEAKARQVRVGDLHAKYPFQDVRGRLKYELGHAAAPILSADADQRLAASEAELEHRLQLRPRITDGRREEEWSDEVRGRIRRYALSMVHTQRETDFIDAEGFGFSRIGPVLKTRYLDLPTTGALPFAQVERPNGQARGAGAVVATPDRVSDDNPFRIPSRERLSEWNAQAELGFMNVGGFGIQPRDKRWGSGPKDDLRVAGFESHRFRSMPEFVDHGPLRLTQPVKKTEGEKNVEAGVLNARHFLADEPAAPDVQGAAAGHERWLIERLELVSLLKHETPAVYVSKELPAMEALAKTPTRRPTGFENEALEKLRAGEDLVVESRANEIHMVGSIRARQQCLECHQTERGTLLGAFSYDLAREARAAK